LKFGDVKIPTEPQMKKSDSINSPRGLDSKYFFPEETDSIHSSEFENDKTIDEYEKGNNESESDNLSQEEQILFSERSLLKRLPRQIRKKSIESLARRTSNEGSDSHNSSGNLESNSELVLNQENLEKLNKASKSLDVNSIDNSNNNNNNTQSLGSLSVLEPDSLVERQSSDYNNLVENFNQILEDLNQEENRKLPTTPTISITTPITTRTEDENLKQIKEQSESLLLVSDPSLQKPKDIEEFKEVKDDKESKELKDEPKKESKEESKESKYIEESKELKESKESKDEPNLSPSLEKPPDEPKQNVQLAMIPIQLQIVYFCLAFAISFFVTNILQ